MYKRLPAPILVLLFGCGSGHGRLDVAENAVALAAPICDYPNIPFATPESNVCDVGGTTPVNGNAIEACPGASDVYSCPIQDWTTGELVARATLACAGGPAYGATVAHEATQDTVSFCCKPNPTSTSVEIRTHPHFARKTCSWIKCKDYDPVKYANTPGYYSSCGCTGSDNSRCIACQTVDATVRSDGGCELSTSTARCTSDPGSSLPTMCEKFCALPPAIAISGDNPLTWECGAGGYVDPGATATDGCGDGLAVITTADTSAVDAALPGSYSVAYRATPEQGTLNSTAVRQVDVVDTTPPVFAAASLSPQTIVGDCAGAPAAIVMPTASDLCSGAATVSCAPLAGNRFGSNEVLCTATDASGNQASAAITVNLIEPVSLVVYPPLDTSSINLVKRGSTVPNKVKLSGCGGADVTSTAPFSVALDLALVTAGASLPVETRFLGVGDAGGRMVLVDDPELGAIYQYNLSTTGLSVTSHTGSHYFDSIVASSNQDPRLSFQAPPVVIETR
jgi:hypothetical protein